MNTNEVANFAAAQREALIKSSIASLTAAFTEWNACMNAGDEPAASAIAKKIDSYRMALKDLGLKVD
jgi:hypothetical protein